MTKGVGPLCCSNNDNFNNIAQYDNPTKNRPTDKMKSFDKGS